MGRGGGLPSAGGLRTSAPVHPVQPSPHARLASTHHQVLIQRELFWGGVLSLTSCTQTRHSSLPLLNFLIFQQFGGYAVAEVVRGLWGPLLCSRQFPPGARTLVMIERPAPARDTSLGLHRAPLTAPFLSWDPS